MRNFFDYNHFYTDSRCAGQGGLFVAIRGERFDGHDFIGDAVDNGAGGILAEEGAQIPPGITVPVFAVPDTVVAYQQIARRYRLSFPALQVVAVTGSVGKTSVKEMLRAIFTKAVGAEHVLYTLGNTNNQIGVPQNLLRLTSDIRYAVIEMGSNHHGEIAPLSHCASPNVALVNSIAPCHLEFFGDLAGVAKEKSEIFSGLSQEGWAIIPKNSPGNDILSAAAGNFRHLRFGDGGDVVAEYLSGSIENSKIKLKYKDQEVIFSWQLVGRHQAANAAAAAAAALALGIDLATIGAGLSETKLPDGRMKQAVVGDITYINDAYNANPESVKKALELLSELDLADKLVLVLGDMFELGVESVSLHREVLRYAAKILPHARIFAVGGNMTIAAGDLPDIRTAQNALEAGKMIGNITRSGDVVFAKGSRGMKLETALPEEAR